MPLGMPAGDVLEARYAAVPAWLRASSGFPKFIGGASMSESREICLSLMHAVKKASNSGTGCGGGLGLTVGALGGEGAELVEV